MKKDKLDEERKAVTFLVRDEIIFCHNCSLCYGKEMKPTFCQEFSRPVDSSNDDKAKTCGYWHPKRNIMDRYNFHTNAPNHKRWYEGDW